MRGIGGDTDGNVWQKNDSVFQSWFKHLGWCRETVAVEVSASVWSCLQRDGAEGPGSVIYRQKG